MSLVKIQLRRDRSTSWAAATVLAEGEVGVETDTGRMKVGDGVRAWSFLPYTDGPLAQNVDGQKPSVSGQTSIGTSTVAARADHAHALPSSPTFNGLTITQDVSVGKALSAATVQAASFSGVTIAHVSGLQSALDAKAESTHTHAITTLDGFPSTTGATGKTLSWDGSSLAWATMSGGGATLTEGSGIDVALQGDGSYLVSLSDNVVNRVNLIPTSDPSNPIALSGNVTLSAGANIQVEQSNGAITISAPTAGGGSGVAGVSSVNGISGNLTIAGATGGGITVSESGNQVLLAASLPQPSSSAPSALASSPAAGTSGLYARADHVHPLPTVNDLSVTGSLDYSGTSVLYSNSFTTAGTPAASKVEGMFAEIDGSPQYSDGADWVTLSTEGHTHAISEVTGLSDELATIPGPGDYVATVNGQSPGSDGNINISTSSSSVTWDDVASRPTNVSYFTNDANYVTTSTASTYAPVQSVAGRTGAVTLGHTDISDLSAGVFGSLKSGSGITVEQDPATSQTILALSGPSEPTSPTPDPSPDTDTQPGPSDPVAPSVSLQPSPELAVGNGVVSILAITEGFTSASYVWEISVRSDTPGDDYQTIVSGADFSGQGTQTLSVDTLPVYGLAKIRCVVTGSVGGALATIASAPLTIQPGSGEVIAQPTSPPALPDDEESNPSQWLQVSINDGGYPWKRYRWLASNTTDEQLALGSVVRGPLWAVLQSTEVTGEQSSSSALASIDPTARTLVERGTDSQGFRFQRLYVKCVVSLYASQPGFNATPDEVIETDVVPVDFYQLQANIVTQPVDTTVTSENDLTFFVEYDAPASVQWFMLNSLPDGSEERFDVTSLYQPFQQSSSLPAPGVYRNTITHRNFPASFIGNFFIAVVTGGTESIPVTSDRVRALGSPPVLTSISMSGGLVQTAGATPVLSGSFVPRTDYRAAFETRLSDDENWVEVGAPKTDTPASETIAESHNVTLAALTAADQMRQYRLKVENDFGVEYSDDIAVSVRSLAPATDQMDDAVVDFGASPTFDVDLPALATTPTYLVVKIEELERSASGEFTETGTIRFEAVDSGATVDAQGNRLGALRYFAPGLQSSTTVRLGSQYSLNTSSRVSLCAVNPFLTSQAGTIYTHGPFLAVFGGSVFYYDLSDPGPKTFVATSEQRSQGTFVNSSSLGVTELDSAVVEVRPRRPIFVTYGGALSGGAGVGALVLPDAAYFTGAANTSDKLLAFGVSFPGRGDIGSSYYLYSQDQGTSFETRRFTAFGGQSLGSIGVLDCAYFDGRWWIATKGFSVASGDFTKVWYSNPEGTAWAQYSAAFPGLSTLSVANGHLFIHTGDGRGTTYILNSTNWATAAPSVRQISGDQVRYIFGQYVTSTGAFGSSPTSIGSPSSSPFGSGARMQFAEVRTTGGIGFDYTLGYENDSDADSGIAVPGSSHMWKDMASGNIGAAYSEFLGLKNATMARSDDVSYYQRRWPGAAVNLTASGPTILGPQVGRYVYMQTSMANIVNWTFADTQGFASNVYGGSALVKLDAYNPNRFRIVEPATTNQKLWRNFNYSVSASSTGRIDFGGSDSLLYIGGYVYGPLSEAADPVFGSTDPGGDPSQLADRFLDGTDRPCYGDLIFTRNKVLKLYRPLPSPPGGSPGGGEIGDQRPIIR